jgi:hypothetical protein
MLQGQFLPSYAISVNFLSYVSYIIDIGDACKGDVVMFEQNIYKR